MRKIFAFLPAAVFTALFVFLSVMLREFSLPLFLIALAFIASGVFACMGRHLFALLCGILPVGYFVWGALTSVDPTASTEIMFLCIAEGIVLFYICYYASIFMYERELNRK